MKYMRNAQRQLLHTIMSKENNRNDFGANVVEALAKRASYVCSNPECKCLTIAATKPSPCYVP